MVFDHQLESDRVIDLTHGGSTLLGSITDPSSILFSIFLRLPLLLLCLILDYSNTIMEHRTSTNTTTTTSQYLHKKKKWQLWSPSLRTIDEETKKEVEVEHSQDQEEDASTTTIVEEEGATEQAAAPFWHALVTLFIFKSTTVSSSPILSVLRRYTISLVRNVVVVAAAVAVVHDE